VREGLRRSTRLPNLRSAHRVGDRCAAWRGAQSQVAPGMASPISEGKDYPAIPLILGTLWAWVPAASIIVGLVVRTELEDRTLRQQARRLYHLRGADILSPASRRMVTRGVEQEPGTTRRSSSRGLQHECGQGGAQVAAPYTN